MTERSMIMPLGSSTGSLMRVSIKGSGREGKGERKGERGGRMGGKRERRGRKRREDGGGGRGEEDGTYAV